MNWKSISLMAIVCAFLITTMGCGSSDSGGGGDDGGDFGETATLAVTGVTADDDFATNGEFTVGFTALDSNGDAIDPTALVGAASLTLVPRGNWSQLQAQTLPTGVTCAITSPTASGGTCTLDDYRFQAPSIGSTGVAGAALIDDSGSMAGTDPGDDRAPAAIAFIDSICNSDVDNLGAAFDFGAGATTGFTDTRDLLEVDGAGNGFVPCSAGNVDALTDAINTNVAAVGGTPLWEAVLEVCNEIVAQSVSGGDIYGFSPALVVLTDGQPNSSTNQTAAEDCVSDNSIVTCTVGLGPASTLDSSSDPTAVAALQSLAAAGSCVYAAATDASALTPIFNAIGVAVSSGLNFATYAISPIPPSGTTVEGTLTVGTETADFSFVVP